MNRTRLLRNIIAGLRFILGWDFYTTTAQSRILTEDEPDAHRIRPIFDDWGLQQTTAWYVGRLSTWAICVHSIVSLTRFLTGL